MNYPASVSDFFKSPKWMMNLLLSGVCVFIPAVGPIVINGWLITGFWGRENGSPETFPDFDFNKFGKYLERGVWPFLVTLVATIPISILACVVIVPLMIIGSLLAPSDHSSAGGAFAAIFTLVLVGLYLAVAIGMNILMTPLTIRAALTQDFTSSFNFTFIKRFIALTWKESIVATLFFVVAAIALVAAGAIAFCLGMYFAIAIVSFCREHLHKQLYQLYLARGGDPVPVNPNLWQVPPMAPMAPPPAVPPPAI
jgi:hypothetical protein